MSLYDTHAAALAATQTILGEACPTITWSNAQWIMVPNSAQRRKDLHAGGFSLNADLVFEVLVAQFGESATTVASHMLQTPIGYLGRTYKADQINIRPGGLQMQVVCNSISQNS